MIQRLVLRYCCTKQVMIPEDKLNSAHSQVKSLLEKRDWKSLVYANYYPSMCRPSFCALRLFDHQLSSLMQFSSNNQIIRERLDYWHNTIDKIYSGAAITTYEPLAICLADACYSHPLSRGYFTRMITIRETLLRSAPADISQLRQYADQLKSSLFALQIQLLHFELDTPAFQRVLSLCGQSAGIMYFITRIPNFMRKNRDCPLPRDLCVRFNLFPDKIWDRVQGKPVPQLHDVVLQMASYAYGMLYEAAKIYKANASCIPKEAYRALLEMVENERTLVELENANFNIFQCNKTIVSTFKLPVDAFSAAKKKQFWLNEKYQELGLTFQD